MMQLVKQIYLSYILRTGAISLALLFSLTLLTAGCNQPFQQRLRHLSQTELIDDQGIEQSLVYPFESLIQECSVVSHYRLLEKNQLLVLSQLLTLSAKLAFKDLPPVRYAGFRPIKTVPSNTDTDDFFPFRG